MSKKQTLADTRELDLSPPPEQPKRAMFRITIEGKEQLVSYQQAFAFAHRLLRKNQYENAAKLLEPLTKSKGEGRVHISFSPSAGRAIQISPALGKFWTAPSPGTRRLWQVNSRTSS